MSQEKNKGNVGDILNDRNSFFSRCNTFHVAMVFSVDDSFVISVFLSHICSLLNVDIAYVSN